MSRGWPMLALPLANVKGHFGMGKVRRQGGCCEMQRNERAPLGRREGMWEGGVVDALIIRFTA